METQEKIGSNLRHMSRYFIKQPVQRLILALRVPSKYDKLIVWTIVMNIFAEDVPDIRPKQKSLHLPIRI